MKSLFSIIILFVITFLWPIFFSSYKVELERLGQMHRCFEDRQIPCRWTPVSEYGYGIPLFNYLPPTPFYFGELIYFMTGSLSLSTKAIYLMPFLISLLFIWTLIRLIKEVNMSSMLVLAVSVAILLSSNNLLSIIFLSVTITWIIFHYLKKRDKIIVIFFYSIIIGILLSSFYLLPLIFERNLVHSIKVNGNSINYLPVSVSEVPKGYTEESFQILTGESEIFDFKQGSNYINFKTETRTHTIIRLSQPYFPNWKIFIDGKETNVEYKNNSLGLMTIILGKGDHVISGRFFDTPIRIISNVLTIATFLFILLLFLYQKKWVKRWISYYKKGIGH